MNFFKIPEVPTVQGAVDSITDIIGKLYAARDAANQRIAAEREELKRLNAEIDRRIATIGEAQADIERADRVAAKLSQLTQ